MKIGDEFDIKLKSHTYRVRLIDMGEYDGETYYECKALNVSPWYQHITREFSEQQLLKFRV